MEITKKHFYISLILVTLLSAFIHVVTLLIYVVTTGKIEQLNIFKILAFDLFAPNLSQGVFMLIISWLFYAGLWLVAYILSLLFIKKTGTD